MKIKLMKLDYNNNYLLDKIFEWRNNEETRSNSTNTNIITREIFSKIINQYKECVIHPIIISSSDIEVGIITFVNSYNRITIGININPDYRNMKVGSLALEELLLHKDEYIGMNIIYANVKNTNKTSLLLFKKYFDIINIGDEYTEFYFNNQL